MEQTITKSQLAAELGISRARISQMVAAGLPVRDDGKLDRSQALAWVASHVDRAGAGGWTARKAPRAPERPAVSSIGATTGPDVQELLLKARAAKLVAEARRAERVEKVAAGELLPAEQVKSTAFDVHRELRDACLAIPARCAAAVHAEVRKQIDAVGAAGDLMLSIVMIENLLSAEIRKALDDLARHVETEGEEQ